MRTGWLLLFATLVVSRVASGQDWQHCKPDGSYSFEELKGSVRSARNLHGYSGWDEKAFSRAGDLTAVAILQTLDDAEMKSPEAINDVLLVLHLAFQCPHHCVPAIGDQQPRVTLLLLEHLQHTASRRMQPKIEETKQYILRQVSSSD
jgi:hypothetical protein